MEKRCQAWSFAWIFMLLIISCFSEIKKAKKYACGVFTSSDRNTEKAIACMQAQRFFVEHCIKECKYVLGMDQFQTRKWQAWHHQIALNFMVACFILNEKLANFWKIPLLSAADIKEWICFKLYKKMTDNEMIALIIDRHFKRQADIDRYYEEQFINVLK